MSDMMLFDNAGRFLALQDFRYKNPNETSLGLGGWISSNWINQSLTANWLPTNTNQGNLLFRSDPPKEIAQLYCMLGEVFQEMLVRVENKGLLSPWNRFLDSLPLIKGEIYEEGADYIARKFPGDYDSPLINYWFQLMDKWLGIARSYKETGIDPILVKNANRTLIISELMSNTYPSLRWLHGSLSALFNQISVDTAKEGIAQIVWNHGGLVTGNHLRPLIEFSETLYQRGSVFYLIRDGLWNTSPAYMRQYVKK